MKEDTVLPIGFDGVFRFTNFSDEDFAARWNSVEYTFPAKSTIPMIIPGESPENVQSIRKKFAKELAIIEFYKTPKFGSMNDVNKGQNPAIYTDSDLAPFIQRCLEPLPIASAKVKQLPKDNEDNYRKDSKGKNVSRVLAEGESLLQGGSGVVA